MPRFFVSSLEGEVAVVDGGDARHIARSLRMRPGEEITLCDGRGLDSRCLLERVEPERVEARILERAPNRSEPGVRLRLYQALPKGEKLEIIVQKSVELGVCEIVPVLTSRCISRPDPKSMARKVGKLELTALEAAKQSGRGRIPGVGELVDLGAAIRSMERDDLAILFYERAERPLREILAEVNPVYPPRSISLLVGSEGGFSPDEVKKAEEAGIAVASLGSRILRCETAPLCALSALLYALGEM